MGRSSHSHQPGCWGGAGGVSNVEDLKTVWATRHCEAERTPVVHHKPDTGRIHHLCHWEGGRKEEEVDCRAEAVGELGGVTKH